MTNAGSQGTDATLASITTPSGGGGILLEPALPGLAARFGAQLLVRPFCIGDLVIAARHRDVTEVLTRDLDFRIAPVNAERIDEVNGPFILGMDRSDRLTRERQALYAALAEIDLDALLQAAATRADARSPPPPAIWMWSAVTPDAWPEARRSACSGSAARTSRPILRWPAPSSPIPSST